MAQAQDDIFPLLDGNELLEALREDFKPSLLMDYGPTRDTMYLNVYRDEDGYVTCHYSGYAVFLPEGVDPSSYLYDGGDLDGITAEHIYPQSKGAGEGNARSDMHSLVPAIWQVNEGRSNYPFGEVPDDETDHWYYLLDDLTEIPTTNLNLYSERLNGGWGNPGLFEPRESVKGDVARAVFYFYTMYKSEADAADPEYFDEMKDILFEWHQQDPVDSLEYVRNFKKATYQNGKANPYILDCKLVQRAYFFDQPEIICDDDFTSSIKEDSSFSFEIYPNPVVDFLNVTFKEEFEKRLDLSSLQKGIYFLTVIDGSGLRNVRKINKI